MSSTPIGTHISQPPNIIPHLPLRIILNRHIAQFRRDLRHSALGDISDLSERVDAEFGENTGRSLWAEGVKGFKGGFEELLLGEVDAEDEDLEGC